jgi:hypothetical protein
MQVIAFLFMLLFITESSSAVTWHIELEVKVLNKWHKVAQSHQDVEIYIEGTDIRTESKCRHNVLFQKHVIEDTTGFKEFRYSIGPVIDGMYEPMYYFHSYTEAVNYYYNTIRSQNGQAKLKR